MDDNDNYLATDQRVNQLLSLKGEEQMLAYELLLPNERNEVWKKHFELELLNETYNSSQINYIKFVSNSLKIDWFEKNKSSQVKNEIENIKNIGLAYFEKEELKTIIASLDKTVRSEINQKLFSPLGSCSCNSSDDWCFWGSYCWRTGGCSYSSSGCGTFLGEPCGGICVRSDN